VCCVYCIPSLLRMSAPKIADGVRYLAVGRIADRVLVSTYSSPDTDSSSVQRYQAVTMRVLSSANTIERYPRLTVTDRDAGSVHYDTGQASIFLVVAAPDYPQRVAFKCLADLKSRFTAAHGEALHKSAEGGLSRASRSMLAEIASVYADPASIDKTTSLLRQVGDVKGIMEDAVQDLLATRENLEVLEDKTFQLRSEAANFQRKAVSAKRSMWWRNCKLKILLAGVVLAIAGYFLVPMLFSSLGWVLESSQDDGKPSPPSIPIDPPLPIQ